MNNLNIQQGSNVEIVSAQIIKKLYDAASTVPEPEQGGTDAAYMSGHISVPYTYESYVNYLAGTIREGTNGIVSTQRSNPSGRFLNLTIDVTNGYYIPFEDPKMVTYLNSIGVGSNGAITTNEAAVATVVANSVNTEITKFNELKYFTSITESKSGWSGTSSGGISFHDWTALEEVDISNFISLGHYAGWAWEDTFYNCTSLKKVTASDKLKKIGYNAFNECHNLEDIVDKNGNPALSGIISLARGAFRKCEKLKNSNFTNCLFLFDFTDSSSANYFSGCTLLTSIALATINDPENPGLLIGLNTNIPYCTFDGCTNLTTVTGLNKVTLFGETAFRNCTNLVATIDLTNVTSLGSGCFMNAYNLTFIGDTSKVTSWGQQSFYCTSNDHRIDLSNVTITLKNDANVGNKTATFYRCILPSTVTLDENVTTILLGMFRYATGILTVTQTITDPNKTGVTTIKLQAFGSSTILSVPYTNVQIIESEAFHKCLSLTTINFPNLTSLSGSNTFWDCANLTTVISLGSITSIPTNTFLGCTSLSSINIPSTVTSYGNGSFKNCTSLYATIDLTGVTNIGVEPFVGSHVSFTGDTSSITTLSSSAFKSSNISGNLSFPSLTSIPSQAFRECINLTTIDFPNLTSISGDYTFRDCSNLTTVTSLGSITSLPTGTFLGCSSLSSIPLDNITSLGDSVFSGCNSLTCIILPSIETIARYNFSSYNGTQRVIDLGSSLTQISQEMFKNNDSSIIIIRSNSVPTMKNNYGLFYNALWTNTTIYVPRDLINSYKTDTDGWGRISGSNGREVFYALEDSIYANTNWYQQ